MKGSAANWRTASPVARAFFALIHFRCSRLRLCEDLVDLSDIFPTLCEFTGAKLPAEKIHGHSFAPQLLGKPGEPREWIHIQNGNDRQVRNHDYMLNNKGQLRRVVELWQTPAKPDENLNPEKEAAARKTLQAVFDALGK